MVVSDRGAGRPDDEDPERVSRTRTEGRDDPAEDPDARLYSGVELETEDGTVVPRQMNVGVDNEQGGGEWPDPDAPPTAPAPGAVDGSTRRRHRRGHGPRTEPHGP